MVTQNDFGMGRLFYVLGIMLMHWWVGLAVSVRNNNKHVKSGTS